MMKVQIILILLLLIAADIAYVGNRKMMITNDGNPASQKRGRPLATGSPDSSGDPDVNNHHSIPRQSWVNCQHGP
ncbi:hypothetical protein SLE2022_101500 [Rubroshorea leprosula]